MTFVIDGALAMACGIAGLFFLRFWKSTADTLFMYFALAFWVLGAHWLSVPLLSLPSETTYYLYVPRLIAFLLIIAGIIAKNRETR
jgi:hypothetical protein